MNRYTLIYIAILLGLSGCAPGKAPLDIEECPGDNAIVFWPRDDEILFSEWKKLCEAAQDPIECYEDKLVKYLDEEQYENIKTIVEEWQNRCEDAANLQECFENELMSYLEEKQDDRHTLRYNEWQEICKIATNPQECFEEKLLNYLDEGQYYQVRQDSECRHRRCINGLWVEDKDYHCKYSCLPANDIIMPAPELLRCGFCLENQMICDNDGIKICKGGRWTTFNCGGNSCHHKGKGSAQNAQYECGECRNGTTTIDNNENSICSKKKCENGKWVIDSVFSNCNKSCHTVVTPNEPDRVICGECVNDTMRCIGSEISKCIDGNWSPISLCRSTNKNGETIDVSCTQVDDNTFQCGECNNNDEYYSNNKQNICEHRVCTNGQWVLDETFKSTCNASCDSTFTSCGQCINGTGNCNDNTVHNCIEGAWSIAEAPCGDVSCTAKLYTPAPPETECEGEDCCPDGSCPPESDPENPDNGDPENPDNEDPENPDNGDPENPDNGDPENPDNGDPENPGADPGSPEDENTDPEQIIVYVCGECLNDTIDIQNDPATLQCIKRTCVNGSWEVEKPCAENSCKIDQENHTYECGDCVNNQYYCEGNNQYVCQDAAKKFHTACTQCSASGCYKQCLTANTCSNDSATKVGILCKSDLTTTPCIGVSCSGNACGKCLNDKVEFREASSKCSKYTCVNGQWSQTACNNVSCLVSNNAYSGCGSCLNGQKRFDQAGNGHCYYHTCKSGTYQTQTYCSGNVSCTVASGKYTGCGECANGQKKYSMSGTTCSYKTCTSGVYQNLKTCPGNNSCKKSGNTYNACGDCINNKTKCTNSYKYTCVNGVWSNATKCSKGCNGATCK